MKFILDANIPRSSLEVFKELGLNAVHVTDVNLGGAADEDIIAYANKSRSIIVTRDLDFGALAILSKAAVYGMVILRLPYSSIASSVNSALKVFLSTVKISKLAHSLVIVELGRYRIRKL